MHRFFSKPETLLRLRRGPLGDYLDRYADWLSEQGFCRVHARLQLVQIADFSLWLDKRGLTLIDVQPAAIDSFIEDRRRRVKPRAERSTLQRFLKLVRPEACSEVSPPLTASQVLRQDFRRHFLEERGAAQVSYLAFQPILLQFLSDCFPDGAIDCARLTAKDVIRFVRRHAYRHSPGRAKLLITALRVFLRYLRLRGNITSNPELVIGSSAGLVTRISSVLDFLTRCRLPDPYPPDAQPCCLRIADQSGILPSVLHKSRKCRIKPNPTPSRISGMIFSLNL